MVTTNQIAEVVHNYLLQPDANNFVIEFSRLSYDILEHGDPDAVKLANRIEGYLADVRAGLISKTAFADSLRALVPPPIYAVAVITSSSTQATDWGPSWAALAPSFQFADKQPA